MTVNLFFIIGIYLLAASYGDHEVTNYLHIRFCSNESTSDVCRIIIFNDDEFGHWVFFTGFVMMNSALLFLQNMFPRKEELPKTDVGLLIFNSLFLSAGVLANLGFEEIGLDLYVVALLAIISAYFLWKDRKQPLFIYYTSAYWVGLVASLFAQAVR